ncbi:thiamine pyrophosphate enzyme, C-terminal TPP binding domain-containing protein 11 [Cupriavidus basilensis OR16]|uniref:Thiamine pyrophosphate enzyme, C-terminal TPP binding domain-containing protein 11 n=1 Tax=Cupriavidus basilensis OR16 TaxID=1127483 RepID=H1S5T8_9BURK|nr:thiamine pyrophosphate-dependent enzyme [Cupriavidus basilensis]EHP42170.1 thiamine pyrophosphate enzyme, C-terminal TPP binding domain-containing protein 11 [Cupriavidus basilensis OR16]
MVVVDGDASLLMQLGGLVTVAGQQPRRFAHFVVNNGTQFTGGVNLRAPGQGITDFCGLARAAGYRHVVRIDNLATLREVASAMHRIDGPAFYELCVAPEPARIGQENPQQEMPDRQFERMGQEAAALSHWLNASGSRE